MSLGSFFLGSRLLLPQFAELHGQATQPLTTGKTYSISRVQREVPKNSGLRPDQWKWVLGQHPSSHLEPPCPLLLSLVERTTVDTQKQRERS